MKHLQWTKIKPYLLHLVLLKWGETSNQRHMMLIRQFCKWLKTWLEVMLTLISQEGDVEKWYPTDPYTWVALSQTWCSKMNLLNPSHIQFTKSTNAKIYNLRHILLSMHVTNTNCTRNLTNNLFLICKTNSNTTTNRGNPNKEVKRRSSKCNNNGIIMNSRYRRTSNYTIRHNISNINSMKMWFSNKIIVNMQNQKL